MSDRAYGVVVVGGGVVGLAAAWRLLRLGCRPLAVVERFHVGHANGSSHGSVRITRSTYSTSAYATMMRYVHAEEWPRLERDAGATLVHRERCPSLRSRSRRARRLRGGRSGRRCRRGGALLRRSPGDRFPAFRFTNDAEILQDRTGGVIAASETVQALHRLVAGAGADVLEDTRVLEIDRGGEHNPDRVGAGRPARAPRGDRERGVASGSWCPSFGHMSEWCPRASRYFRLGVPRARSPRGFTSAAPRAASLTAWPSSAAMR